MDLALVASPAGTPARGRRPSALPAPGRPKCPRGRPSRGRSRTAPRARPLGSHHGDAHVGPRVQRGTWTRCAPPGEGDPEVAGRGHGSNVHRPGACVTQIRKRRSDDAIVHGRVGRSVRRRRGSGLDRHTAFISLVRIGPGGPVARARARARCGNRADEAQPAGEHPSFGGRQAKPSVMGARLRAASVIVRIERAARNDRGGEQGSALSEDRRQEVDPEHGALPHRPALHDARLRPLARPRARSAGRRLYPLGRGGASTADHGEPEPSSNDGELSQLFASYGLEYRGSAGDPPWSRPRGRTREPQ